MCLEGGWGNEWVLIAVQLIKLLAKCDFQSNSIVAKSKLYFIDLYWILKNSIY